MDVNFYIEKLNLEAKSICKIEHEDSLSADVYALELKDNTSLILKICSNADRYKREVYFLNRLQDTIPVPKIIDHHEPALLMEYLPGQILRAATFTQEQSFAMGKLLAQLHEMRTSNYGDLTRPGQNTGPIQEMIDYLEESIDECKQVVEPALLDKAKKYVEQNMVSSEVFDGPCIVHRDFKPGNVFMHDDKITGLIDWAVSSS